MKDENSKSSINQAHLHTLPFNAGLNSNNYNFTGNNFNNSNLDPDEQFVLDLIRTSKQESINSLLDMLRLQESKSVLLIRVLERYHVQLNGS